MIPCKHCYRNVETCGCNERRHWRNAMLAGFLAIVALNGLFFIAGYLLARHV
jgi:hypothetical protein